MLYFCRFKYGADHFLKYVTPYEKLEALDIRSAKKFIKSKCRKDKENAIMVHAIQLQFYVLAFGSWGYLEEFEIKDLEYLLSSIIDHAAIGRG